MTTLERTSNVRELRSLRVAAVMDEFTHNSFRHECELHQLTPEGVTSQLQEIQPEILFIESAWRGKDDLWANKISRRDTALLDAIDWCREHNVPTVFWNKEDPVHFGTFLQTAALFDHVFTTDIDVIHRYRRTLGHDRIYLLPFAAQPAMFSPLDGDKRIDAFCFAGAHYKRYPDRARDFHGFVHHLTALHPFLIYDRNHGKDDPDYAFPDAYTPLILGHLPYERVQRAYKGYTYTVNMNSVTQSQSMCARRVFELLASNAVVVSNYARGIKTLLGDIVVTTSNGAEAARRVEALTDRAKRRKLKLAGLRKVMSEHTYLERFSYLVSKVFDEPFSDETPVVELIAFVTDVDDAKCVKAVTVAQSRRPDVVTLVAPSDQVDTVMASMGDDLDEVRILTSDDERLTIAGSHVAVLHPADYYGENYLLDLVLATKFSDVPAIGKRTYHRVRQGLVEVVNDAPRYSHCASLALRRALIRADALPSNRVIDLALQPEQFMEGVDCIAIDEFNYCEDGATLPRESLEPFLDLEELDAGVPLKDLRRDSERASPSTLDVGDSELLSLDVMSGWFGKLPDSVHLELSDLGLQIDADLSNTSHKYLWADGTQPLTTLGCQDPTTLHLEVTGELRIRLALRFFNDDGESLGSKVLASNSNEAVEPPEGATRVLPALRLAGKGRATIRRLALGGLDLSPSQLVLRHDHLLVTNLYPAYDSLYRNAFVHRRVQAYADTGLRTDVMCFVPGVATRFREFENVDVVEGGRETLEVALADTSARSVSVHFMLPAMWPSISRYLERNRGQVQVWIHGYEVQPSHRRSFNFATDEEYAEAKRVSKRRLQMWREIFSSPYANLRFVFVSQYLADQVMEDVGVELPRDRYFIIHNPIDTDLFAYRPKSPDQRLKVLSIRPYASAAYANDLSVEAILALRDEPWFEDAEFRLIGDGPLYGKTVAPLRNLPNVVLEQGFVTQRRISELHQNYGVFLCPSRMDTHGVSRDEAMSSGLVPIVSRVGAVPEFVDEDCALLTDADDPQGIADAIRTVVKSPEQYLSMSRAAAARVRHQAGYENVVPAELDLIYPTG